MGLEWNLKIEVPVPVSERTNAGSTSTTRAPCTTVLSIVGRDHAWCTQTIPHLLG